MSDSLRPHELQHARPPCPSPTPGVCPNPCPSSRWRYPTILSSVVPFSSCPQSFPASGSFQMSQLFAWGGQSIGVSASTSVLLMNTQGWSPLRYMGWLLCSASPPSSWSSMPWHCPIGWVGKSFVGREWTLSMPRLDLLAAQGTLKSLLQLHSSKASILWHSAFFIVQLSHPYMTTGKTTALTRWTFVDKVMSLLFNMLSRLVITFLPRSKHLLAIIEKV